MTVRTITTVAVTAGAGRDVHKGTEVKDADHERAYSGIEAKCGSDRGRRGSVRAMQIVDSSVTCSKCIARPEVVGSSYSFNFGA